MEARLRPPLRRNRLRIPLRLKDRFREVEFRRRNRRDLKERLFAPYRLSNSERSSEKKSEIQICTEVALDVDIL